MKNKKISTPIKITLAALVVVALAALAVLAYQKNRDDNTSVPNPDGSSKLDLSPASEDDQALSDRLKEESAKPSPPAPGTNGGKQAVTPFIVDASQYGDIVEVRSSVPGVIENGGTCTIIMTLGSQRLEKQVPGIADATATRCQNLSLKRSDFPVAGTWQVTASYSSPKAAGTSDAAKMEIK